MPAASNRNQGCFPALIKLPKQHLHAAAKNHGGLTDEAVGSKTLDAR